MKIKVFWGFNHKKSGELIHEFESDIAPVVGDLIDTPEWSGKVQEPRTFDLSEDEPFLKVFLEG
jgi:hypothetical protein